ncbi:MAG: hypothetical protein OJF50_006227 [Nitrospira sp.]|jgi:hypothetical protein|nr:hypothetical protein [Nitrospira sp.]
MKQRQSKGNLQQAAWLTLVLALGVGSMATGCARLPYTKETVHEDERVAVTIQQEVTPRDYTHPGQLTSEEMASILRGFSIREQQRLPLRWFAEETAPKPLLREDEVQRLAPYLAKALQKVGPNERVHFQSRTPQLTAYDQEVVEGWIAMRDPYFYLTVDQFHTPITIRRSDLYDRNYPTPPPPPRDYILYFEPGRFWITDDKGRRGVDFRQFLRSGEAGPSRAPQPSPPAAP